MFIFCSYCGRENKETSDFCCGCKNILFGGFLPADKILKKRYRIISLIKSGGMGAIYKATDNDTELTCAVKELLPPFGDEVEQEKVFLWFQREALILSKLAHPNLPSVMDFFINGVRYYLVMEFIEGEDLQTKLFREGRPGFSEKEVIKWMSQVMEVLSYLHNQEPPIIYRDIKPSNIMLKKDGEIKLIDFGLARVIHQKSKTQTIIGTTGYAPLEQLQGKADTRSDIYSLGATMHHLLTGKIPEPFHFKFEPVRNMAPEISTGLENIVMKAVANIPSKRFASAKEMLEALEKI